MNSGASTPQTPSPSEPAPKGPPAPMVQFRGVMKRFGKTLAVEKIDLDIEEGNLVTLLGPSGCGKTTLLRMVAGLETPTEGDIFIRGRRINDVPIHLRNLGMIFQNYALFPHKTIFDNVAFGLKYRKIPKEEIAEKVSRALQMVRLPGVEKRMPSQLSGGQQQRIALARAIVIEPDVLLMDEPLSALDENLREEMRREIDNIQRMLGVTTIFVTHDQREALSMSDKIVVMKDGRKQQEGGPEEVYNRPSNHFVADFLGHSNFEWGKVQEIEGDRIQVRLDNGHTLWAQTRGERGDWKVGDAVQMMVRAQKFEVHPRGEVEAADGVNIFEGTVIDRSYMGGEVSYFIDIGEEREIHVISMMRTLIFSKGDRISVTVDPKHCHLLPADDETAREAETKKAG